MKNKLTVNDIALANIRQRKKQYLIMIIGIVLAMVFSGSIVFFVSAAKETSRASMIEANGYQNIAMGADWLSEEDYELAKQKNVIQDYAVVDVMGYAYSSEGLKRLGCDIGRANDKFRQISNQKLIEGRLPEAKDEIAIESEALKRLGYRDAGVGSTITVNVDIQNGNGYGETVEKNYVITGILKDKKSNFAFSYDYDSTNSSHAPSIPAMFVADDTVMDSGGRTKLIAYIVEHQSYFRSSNGEQNLFGYLEKNYPEFHNSEYQTYGTSYDSSSVFDYHMFNNGELMLFIVLVLIFASCVAIVNSFNNNLKERRQQIGMLRAVGTTKRQIIHIFGREAFIIALISTPISILISYLLVYLGINLMSDNAVMTKSIWTLPIAAVINMTVVMLAALVPLIIASGISPMQAIRDVRTQRRAKVKKIRSKKQFTPAVHLARRNGQLYKGSKIAVGMILAVSIMFSAFGFSFLAYQKENKPTIPYDYTLYCSSSDGATQAERQTVASNPLVKSVRGTKSDNVYVKADYSDMLFRVFNSWMVLDADENYTGIKSAEDYTRRITECDANKIREYNPSELEELGIADDVWNMTISSYDQAEINSLEKDVYDGRIDYNKLRSGEEIIMIMPKKAELLVRVYKNGYGESFNYDDEVGKDGDYGYKSVITAESKYKAGDEIEIYSPVTKSFKTVKIGALVSPGRKTDRYDIVSTHGVGLITSHDGLYSINNSSGYERLYMSLYEKPDEQTDTEFTEFLDSYVVKYQAYLSSTFKESQQLEHTYRSLMTAILVIMIISFVICASIINNSITAQIRENKRAIGTLRAVGAGEGVLVKSYCLRMMSMFGWGAGVGFGIYIIGYFVIGELCKRIEYLGLDMLFRPLPAVFMVVLLFVVCLINLWSKVRREMKNSIVENIREL